MYTLHLYENVYDQKINHNKSTMFLAKQTYASCKIIGLHATSFQVGSFPCLYLGAPICTGNTRASHIEFSIHKMQKKLALWKGALLSKGGRLILLKYVLSNIPIHLLVVLNMPRNVLHKLNQHFFVPIIKFNIILSFFVHALMNLIFEKL